MRLSKNFTLDEFLVSEYAERHDIDMTPPPEVVENIRLLVQGCLQPLRDEVGAGIYISSGYRPPELNDGIGGSKTSAHMTGSAVDFKVVGQTPFDTCELIVAMDLPFDQVIHEFGRWVHMGVADILRRQQLTAYRSDGKTRYAYSILRMEDVTKSQGK
jgi:zinc D-Ala-D-Ala carboxypeptidase